MLSHRFKNIHGTQNIYFYIVYRVTDRFTDIYLCSEMKYYFWSYLLKYLRYLLSITDIDFIKMHRRIAVVMSNIISLSCTEIIDDEDFITTLYAGIDEM